MDGKYEEGIGGGVSQVATTVFNAAWEAGIQIARAPRARALHQPLPGRARRHGQLPGRRPEARQRHAALDRPQGRPTTRAASSSASSAAAPSAASRAIAGELEGDRPAEDRARARPDALRGRPHRRVRRGAVARDPRRARSSTRAARCSPDETWYTHYRYEARIVRVGTKPRPEPSRAAEEEKPKDEDAPPPTTTAAAAATATRRLGAALGLSTAAIASASQAGMRVGRSVSAFTQACAVQPSATIAGRLAHPLDRRTRSGSARRARRGRGRGSAARRRSACRPGSGRAPRWSSRRRPARRGPCSRPRNCAR